MSFNDLQEKVKVVIPRGGKIVETDVDMSMEDKMWFDNSGVEPKILVEKEELAKYLAFHLRCSFERAAELIDAYYALLCENEVSILTIEMPYEILEYFVRHTKGVA
jgi:hypothetical protein